LKRKAEKEAKKQRNRDSAKRSRNAEQSPAPLSINSTSTTPLSLSEPTKKTAGRPKLNEKRIYKDERKRKLDSLPDEDKLIYLQEVKIKNANYSRTYRQNKKIKILKKQVKILEKEKDQILNIPST